jgi:glycosyltransferase involved in cell wall biosynthesis
MAEARKTVLFITPGGRSAPGGITRMVDYCVRSWPKESSFALRVIDSYGPGTKIHMPFYALRALLLTFWLLLTGQAQLLHVNFSERLSVWRKGLFVLLGGLFGRPVIMHLHGAEFADYIEGIGPRRLALVATILKRAERIIVLGSYWRDFLEEKIRIDPAKIVILCNAVPDMTKGITREAREECRMLFLGVVGARKGVPQLLEALARPEMQQLRWRMIIAGNGEVELYKEKAHVMGLANVEFPGLLNEEQVRAELSQADVFVLPSRREGLPMAILEALSYGCPVVATPVGSIPDAVIDAQTGLLAPVDDSQALAVALARLIADADYRMALGIQARKLFEEKFTIAAYNRVLEDIYLRVAG